MSSQAERDELTGAANQMMRRLLHEVESLQARSARDAEAIRAARQAVRDRHAEVERDARNLAAGFQPADLGAELRTELAWEFGDRPEPSGPQPSWQSFEDATSEWERILGPVRVAAVDGNPAVRASSFEHDVRAVIAEHRAWKAKTFKRRSSEPRPPEAMWAAVRRLSEIRAALPALRDQFVAARRASVAHLNDGLADEVRRQAAELDDACVSSGATVADLAAEAGLLAAPWSDPRWASPDSADRLHRVLRIGELEVALPSRAGFSSIPALVDYPLRAGLAIGADVAHRASAIDLARSIVLRMLAATPPGKVRFVFVDPISLGQSVAEFRHLAEFDTRLVDVKTWTSERDIEARLADLSDHLEVVISTYLRGQFDSIDDYNRHAGEVAEPYRVLVIFDYPEAFASSAMRQLLSIIENGPRCGVQTLLIYDPAEASADRLIHSMQRVELTGPTGSLTLAEPIGQLNLPFLPDATPPVSFSSNGHAASPLGDLLVRVGGGARSSQAGPVTLERVLPIVNRMVLSDRAGYAPALAPGAAEVTASDPASWWSGITAAGAFATIGRAGAHEVAAMHFSSTEIAGGAILVGLPRSGKSTALHAVIVSMAMLYSPAELELYLVDSKHGVEFKIYERLPHARLVSIHSEREFSVAVLESLDSEIRRRAELMKRHAAGTANITEFRAATDELLPRIVLIMDEFHELFEEDDTLGHRAFQAFSNIVRQGPFAGVHVVVSSQTLSSMPAMDRSTLSLLPMRVAFMCNELDADLVMGDTNRDVKSLSQQGEGIYNAVRGDSSHNQPFRGLYIAPAERERLLRAFESRAAGDGFTRTPRVFDGDQLAERPSERPQGTSTRPVFAVGEPFSLDPLAGISLRRGRGANLLFLGETEAGDGVDSSLQGAVHSCLADAVAQGLSVHALDFLGDGEDDGEGSDLMSLCDRLAIRYRHGSALEEELSMVMADIKRRRAEGEYRAAGALFLLNGLERALDLAPEDRYADDDDRAAAAGGLLAEIIRDGPEVGWHVIASLDGLAQFDRRLGRDLLREFDWRLAGSAVGATDIAAITESYTEGGVRPSQLLLVDHAKGQLRRIRAYPRHTAESLNQSLTQRSNL